MKSNSFVLKLAIFATGLSGIVAEYTLSTMASYFLGDSVLHWTMIVSTMLFAMGFGSRLSKFIESNLLENMILVEFTLSILTTTSPLMVYLIAGYTDYKGFFIYFFAILIGLLIGLEIPLVTRINDSYENLRTNIAAVMEKDYYGSLLGGAFFAFVGLPYLGLTYTPFVLGLVNFGVAIWLYFKLYELVEKKYHFRVKTYLAFSLFFIFAGLFLSKPIVIFGEQARYKDLVIYSQQSHYQKIVITQWKEHYWLFLNGNQQLSTLDEFLYHEPMVHPVMNLAQNAENILVLGGGDGCAARELLKYKSVKKITLVDLDPAMTDLGQKNEIFVRINQNSMNNPKVKIVNEDGFRFLEKSQDYFDLILVDLPDPKSIEVNKLYTNSFYQLCYRQLRPNGVFITQSGSPYYATKAFRCVEKTMQSVGFNTLPLHNQILTMGQWGWIVGHKNLKNEELKHIFRQMDFKNIDLRWLNKEAMLLITSFGKDLKEVGEVEINTIQNPVLMRYYKNGNWDLF